MSERDRSQQLLEKVKLENPSSHYASSHPELDGRSLQDRFSSFVIPEESEARRRYIDANFQALKQDYLNHVYERRKSDFQACYPGVTDEEFRAHDKAFIEQLARERRIDPMTKAWNLFLDIHGYNS